jgi:hypothetical protein
MIGALKSIEPIGFLSFAPASAGQIGRMWIGGSSKIARTAEVLLRVQAGLFGSGSAGLGGTPGKLPGPSGQAAKAGIR